MKKFCQCFVLFVVGVGLVALTAANVFAQADKPAAKAEFTLDEIVVTAERRETSAQDTPVAVSAWDESVIDEQNIGGAQDLMMRMPSTYVSTTSVTIRGVGRTSGALGTEPGVGIFLDGFYNQEGTTYLADMFDVERIENVRGPQSTLYGRATIGGAVNIISKKPTKEWSGQIKAIIGNYEEREFHAAFGGPSGIDNLYYRIRLSDTYFGGYQEDIIFHDEYAPIYDHWRVTGKLLYEPTDYLTFYFNYDVTDLKDRPYQTVFQEEWPTAAHGGLPMYSGSKFPNPYYAWTGYPSSNPTLIDHYKVASNFLGSIGEDKVETSLTATLDAGNFRVLYLGAYRDWDYRSAIDLDYGPMPSSYASKEYSSYLYCYEWSSELQLMYGGDNIPISLISGLYYFDRNRRTLNKSRYFGTLYNDPNDPAINVVEPSGSVHTTDAIIHDINEAAYAQIDYDFLDAFTVTIGARYAVDIKKGDEFWYYQYNQQGTAFLIDAPSQAQRQAFAPWIYAMSPLPYIFSYPSGPLSNFHHKGDWDAWTYTLGLDYKPLEGTLIYGKYSRGYKPGGFVLAGFQAADFDAEHVDAYEAGWKQQWKDNRFSTNLASYYYSYTDLQVSGWDGTTSYVTNATDSEIYGVEFDASGYIIENLLASVSYSYLHTEFLDYPDQLDSAHQELGRQDLSGNQQPYAPENKVSVNATYTFPTNFGDFSWHALYYWQDSIYTSRFNTPDRKADAYDRVDTELMWNSPAYKWRITLWMKNALDETTVVSQSTGDSSSNYAVTATYIAPRTYGIDVSFKW